MRAAGPLLVLSLSLPAVLAMLGDVLPFHGLAFY